MYHMMEKVSQAQTQSFVFSLLAVPENKTLVSGSFMGFFELFQIREKEMKLNLLQRTRLLQFNIYKMDVSARGKERLELVFATGTGLLFFDMRLRKPKVVQLDGESSHIL